MPLLGKGAVAMWWRIAAERRIEFGDWHSHEHFPERMGIPGFLRGSRWSSVAGDGRFFVLYELADYETLVSPAYRERLNNPTPWSSALMPHHLEMVRSQARVLSSHGGGVATALTTIRLSPRDGEAVRLRGNLDEVLRHCPTKLGLTGAHLLSTETPDGVEPTTEQTIRGGDEAADWIVLLSGYDPSAVRAAVDAQLDPARLAAMGAATPAKVDEFRLAYALAATDVRPG